MPNSVSIFEFGRELLETGDLDPVYIVLHGAHFAPMLLRRWLLAYWCFYHVGTASWIVENESEYWRRMETAAGSKDYPRASERRHFRGGNARNSVTYLRSRGTATLFDDLVQAFPTAKAKIEIVQTWIGFGPWIAFKVADMLERLGICPVTFDLAEAMYDSPRKSAEALWEEVYGEPPGENDDAGAWAVDRILFQLGAKKAPPRYERRINVQEAETILCKYKSYRSGHYHVGKDIHEVREGLLRFARCGISQRLLAAGSGAELW